MNVRTSTNNYTNKQINNVNLFLYKNSTMFSKVVTSTQENNYYPIILNAPHHIKHKLPHHIKQKMGDKINYPPSY